MRSAELRPARLEPLAREHVERRLLPLPDVDFDGWRSPEPSRTSASTVVNASSACAWVVDLRRKRYVAPFTDARNLSAYTVPRLPRRLSTWPLVRSPFSFSFVGWRPACARVGSFSRRRWCGRHRMRQAPHDRRLPPESCLDDDLCDPRKTPSSSLGRPGRSNLPDSASTSAVRSSNVEASSALRGDVA